MGRFSLATSLVGYRLIERTIGSRWLVLQVVLGFPLVGRGFNLRPQLRTRTRANAYEAHRPTGPASLLGRDYSGPVRLSL